ncbi:hypothetical protein A6035_01000 [Dietzia lutea]|uniref:Uncharacterized protein n=1 Tax=Dietzia lutea TaxID=546160 RepID=A0A2S1R421_9ACTN|nr:hypothetical protein A6035_01000 [Dietzia lutea]
MGYLVFVAIRGRVAVAPRPDGRSPLCFLSPVGVGGGSDPVTSGHPIRRWPRHHHCGTEITMPELGESVTEGTITN